ncbi:amino acid adenylation domain-containing protein [Candidatus Bathyarchaeota archaeon]|nr:MAG: amino acid adenylation domain-containing protein [Candidatus Bathyarchaeota archaeon]
MAKSVGSGIRIADFISHLYSLDVRLTPEGERLRVDGPKGTLNAVLREQIAEHKAEILQFFRNADNANHFAPPPISRAAKDEASPLSFAQERLWFLEQFEPGGSAYNICRAARLIGLLKIEALEQSLSEIMRRHEVLRTRFQVVDGRPVQVRAPAQKLSISLVELSQLSHAERDGEVARLIADEGGCPFDLSAGPLLQAMLLRLGNDDHMLILTTHHIASDAWSMGILTRELWTLYEAYANGKPSPLPDLPVQYTDYAVWQRQWLKGKVLESQLSYWKKQLAHIPILNLPTDRPRPVLQSFRGARQPISLPESLTAAVNELSRREGVTQFMTLLAAFQVLLYRYSGQEDVVVGSPIANRNRTEIEGLIGFFVNTLVLRTDLSRRPTFKELLLRVRDVCLGAYAHQDLPFEKLVQELHPERDLSRNPLFQVMFVLQNTPRPFPETSGFSIERVDVLAETSPFDLSLYLRERNGKLIGFIEYSTDLFDRSTIERMIGHFQTLLEGIVANPDQLISTLPLLTEAERHQLLVEWNDTAAEYPKDSCIHELFEAQVERTPDAIAAEFEGKRLSYRELNSRANQLAHYLRRLGVGPESLVGICIERSLEMIVGLLGILKAGGAYVPLDPAYPRERLRFMLEDAQVSVLLTHESLIENGRLNTEDRNAPPFSILEPQIKTICLDTDWEKIAQQSERNPDTGATAQNLAYVIYTSGSAGQPKGVQVEHRSVINCLYSMRQQIGLTEKDILLAVTTISFDITALETYLPLTTGAKLVLARGDEALDGRQLRDRLTKCGATTMQATPSTWRLLLEARWEGDRRLKILCGGEVLSRELADQLLERARSVWNLYGPTETTIWSAIHKVQPGDRSVPIGSPIANTQIYLLDSRLQPEPLGVPCELYIGGAGLARGYLNRPDLTAERFIPNPFNDEPGSRLYRTGDRAHYLCDGNIEFLGRVDDQVKIRGYRIEPREIESVLNQHPAVKETVVVLRERDSSGDKDLVAYFVPRQDSSPSVIDLRGFLRRKVPQYMMPAILIAIDALPLSPNGKVDRSKLPPPDDSRPNLEETFVEPRTEAEQLVAQVWEEVLKLDKVGICDNFFEFGGHSLSAIQVISRLREVFGKNIPLRLLFEEPTVAGLVPSIEKTIRGDLESELPPIVPVPRNGPLPLSVNQEQLWNLDQMIPGTHFFNMPYVYRLSGELSIAALEKSLKELIRRHEALRTVFAKVDGCPVQVIKEVPDLQLPVVDLLSLPPGDVEQQAAGLILEERERPFNLATGPLLRTKLLRLTDNEYLLLVTMHHIISDHWSMRIFRREVLALYEAFSQGRSSPLPEPAIQFADYASWERRLLNEGLLNTQLTFWKKQLAGSAPQL